MLNETNETISPLRILLIEDDEDDRHFFTEAVRELDIPHEISFAKDCFELFSKLEEGKSFDLFFLDINLPIMDGRECLKQIKLNARYKDVPVIVFTGSHSPMDIDFVYDHGAHYYVVKPYAHINYVASLKTVFDKMWREKQARPEKENFVLNLAFSA